MKKSVFLFFAFCLSVDCHQSLDIVNTHKNLKYNDSKPLGVFSDTPSKLPPNLKLQIQNATSFDDLFEIRRFVKLEASNNSLISYINDFSFQDNNFFVVDKIQRKVFQFSSIGKFVRQVGRVGKGPGEYQNPSAVNRFQKNKVSILDHATGKI